ncbi:Demethylsterigmatocystin 6-O-methyltransferase-like protein [Hapsidospora chrysogenum ATCC 11550]|uniref:Demethylsterigmatocystin 6-O-methyltransferase-like protein n=1 Tax=Hapsidospora chrysogenum (strain ATCC 11550 / CBS 779.69 / DSM 880 / IAM 14645 / JCM 23072 / IMI 49137) TaxID=857340 RepID=A0A086ST66_HAPC1|nr:Demethylsterigmatocystin 6-O-methyltransferase-like protein [Hapsidospora chrysogenum ATCC 11550]
MASQLDSLIEQLGQTTKAIQHDPAFFQDLPEQRLKLLKATQELYKTTQEAIEAYTEFLIGMAQAKVIRLFIKWKVFEAVAAHGPISISSLAEKAGADVTLITRLARMLVCTRILKQNEAGELSLAPSADIFVAPHPASALVQFGHAQVLRHLRRKEPVGRHKTITAYAYGNADLTVWEHLNSDPAGMAVFMTSMVAMSQMQPMVGSYDFSSLIAEASKSDDRALVVDVGGGKGHAVKAIAQATPGLPLSRCVVEDMDEVIQEAKATADPEMSQVQFVVTDFHKEQPVKDALIYYIRRCLHDYGDDEVVGILEQTQKSMANDSKLLIVEQILDNPPDPFAAATDVFISTIGGKERTMDDFEHVTSRAGLRIVKVHRSPGSDVGIIECEKTAP